MFHTHNVVMLLALLLTFGCQSERVARSAPPPPFPVTVEQEKALTHIYIQAHRKAGRLVQPGHYLSGRARPGQHAVADVLVAYDEDVQAVLDEDQWTNYDTHQRARWAELIYQRVGRRSTGGVSYTGGYMSNATTAPPVSN